MINLLPQEIKQAILRERFSRFIIFSSSVTALILVIGISLLSVPWFVLTLEERNLKNQQEILLKAPALARVQEIETKLKTLNTKLEAFQKNQARAVRSSVVFEKILARRNGIQIQSFVYGAPSNKESSIQMRLKGVARNRDALLRFVDTLEADESFSSVRLPISNLLRGTDIEFVLTFDVMPESLLRSTPL